jgi:S1-C subfamily serine protease
MAGQPVELGVTVRPVRIPPSGRGIGILELGVAAGSPAEYPSLRIGDVLTGLDGRHFASADGIQRLLDRVATTVGSVR